MDPLRQFTSFIRVRLSASDAHYGGQLIDGAHMLSLFGDVATELAILCDGDEGLLVGYEKIEFLAPLFPGDFSKLDLKRRCPTEARSATLSRGLIEYQLALKELSDR